MTPNPKGHRLKIGYLLFLLFLLLTGGNPVIRGETMSDSKYKYAYYLFRMDADEQYIPLLISKEPLEVLKSKNKIESCALITTYERDSVWSLRDESFNVDVKNVNVVTRIISLKAGESYRYQQITPEEVVKLMENPEGSIALHRRVENSPHLTISPQLLRDFKLLTNKRPADRDPTNQ